MSKDRNSSNADRPIPGVEGSASVSRRDVLQSGVAAGVSLPLLTSALATVGASDAAAKASPKRGGILRVGYTSGTVRELLDPARASMGNDSMYCANIFDRLVHIENDFSVRSELAESWKANTDGSAWTFVLRPNLKFSDGTALTTQDVAYSFKRILDKSVGSPSYGPLSQTLAPDGIKIKNDRTIVFNLKGTNSQFPLIISTRNFAIVKKGTTKFTVETAIGSGSFILTSFAPGEKWEMVRNPHHWREGRPYLDGIRQVNIVEPSTLVQSLLAGSLDVIGQVGPAQARLVKGSDKARLVETKNSAFMYVVMDLTQKPFTDPRVVKAVKMAVDRQVLLNVAFQGYGTLTSDINIWPDHPTYPPGLGIRKQEIQQAKKLLAEAGYPNGIDLQLYTSPSLTGMVEMATAFAEIVKPAGIRISIKQENPGTYWNKIWQKNPFYISYSGTRPPVATISNLYSTTPAYAETKLKNKKIDEILSAVKATLDQDKQTKLLQQAWLIIANEGGASISFALNVLWGLRNSVHGVKTHTEDNLQFGDAYLS